MVERSVVAHSLTVINGRQFEDNNDNDEDNDEEDSERVRVRI